MQTLTETIRAHELRQYRAGRDQLIAVVSVPCPPPVSRLYPMRVIHQIGDMPPAHVIGGRG